MGYFNNFATTMYDINGDGIFDNILNLTTNVVISETLINNATFYDLVTIEDGERPEQLSYRLYGSTEYYWSFLLINSNINNIWNDWPKSSRQLLEYCEQKYSGLVATTENDLTGKFDIGETITGSISGAIGTITKIHNSDKYLLIDLVSGTFSEGGEDLTGDTSSITSLLIKSKTFAPKYHLDIITGAPTSPKSAGTYPFTFFDFETMMNDLNRSIKVIKPNLITEVLEEFNSELVS